MPKPEQEREGPLVNPNKWDAHHGTYIAGRSFLDGVEELSINMNNKWGVGRLRLLVDPEWREKFDRQRYLTQAAIENGDLARVRAECDRMDRAWRMLDKLATAAGALPLYPKCWEATLDDGTVLAIVPNPAHAAGIRPEGRRMAVYTMDEVARILSDYKRVNEIKIRWPGAEVTLVRQSVPDPLNAIQDAISLDDPLDDPIPF